MKKKRYSKTLWVNAIFAMLTVLEVKLNLLQSLLPVNVYLVLAVVVPVVNAGLRFFTTQPLAGRGSAPLQRSGQAGFADAWLMVVVFFVLSLGLAFWGGTKYAEPVPVTITWSPAAPLPGGGLRLETRADPAATPAQPIPKGATVTAAGKIIVKPNPVVGRVERKDGALATDGAKDGPLNTCSCEDITIDYTTIRDANGQPSMQASAGGGQVTGGWHSPIADMEAAPERLWGLGLSTGLGQESGGIGLVAARKLGPFDVMADVFRQDRDIGARVNAILWLK